MGVVIGCLERLLPVACGLLLLLLLLLLLHAVASGLLLLLLLHAVASGLLLLHPVFL